MTKTELESYKQNLLEYTKYSHNLIEKIASETTVKQDGKIKKQIVEEII